MGIVTSSNFAISTNTGNLDLVSNSGFINLGYYNATPSTTRLGRPDNLDYIFMNGQKYNFKLPTVSSGDYLIMQINGTDVTVKKATVLSSGGNNYLTV